MDELSLGDRELDVMAVLWEVGDGTVAEVREKLPADLAYTTVLTILRKLEAKGLVRHKVEGKAHRYYPRVAQKNARRSVLGGDWGPGQSVGAMRGETLTTVDNNVRRPTTTPTCPNAPWAAPSSGWRRG